MPGVGMAEGSVDDAVDGPAVAHPFDLNGHAGREPELGSDTLAFGLKFKPTFKREFG